MKKSLESLEELIRENLQNAAENGYDLSGWSPSRVAQDMMVCGDYDDYEGYSVEDVAEVVRRIREKGA